MKSIKKIRNIAAVLVFSVTAAFLLPVYTLALEPSFEVTEGYSKSVYYDRLCEVELTGDFHRDIVNVALSQVGYHEGWIKEEYHGGSTNGWKNCSEYNMIYWGMDAAWCAMFISWCARQAQIPRYILNSAARAMTDGLNGTMDYCFHIQYYNKDYYTPKTGDLIFFNDGIQYNWSHVGLVVEVTEDEVITVEGNKLNAVRMGRYPLDHETIRGYGVYYSPMTAEEPLEYANICRVHFVSENSERGTMPEDEETQYTFENIYAMDGTRFDIPEKAFVREGSTLYGYHAQRDDTGDWYCGEYGWLSDVEMVEGGIEPTVILDGRPWYIEGDWAGLESVTMYTVWMNEYGLLESDAELPEEFMADSEGWVCVYRDIHEELWHYKYIRSALMAGLVDDVDSNYFCPDDHATRAMLVTALYRLAGEPEMGDKTVRFEDVPADSEFFDAVCWAYENGIVKGMSETEFAPEGELSRQQLATMLYRCFGTEHEETEAAEDVVFADADTVADWAAEGMAWAVSNGIINGLAGTETGETLLAPWDNTTRAQACTIVVRLAEAGE